MTTDQLLSAIEREYDAYKANPPAVGDAIRRLKAFREYLADMRRSDSHAR